MKCIKWNLSNKVIALTTTKEFGNLAYQVEDDYQVIRKRRKELAEILNIQERRMIFTHQSHSDTVKEVTSADEGAGMLNFTSGVSADAIYTKEKELALGIFHADCVPIFIYVPNKNIIGIIHAGHIGTLKCISEKFIMHLKDKEGIDPQDILVQIGPSHKFFSYIIDKSEAGIVENLGYEKALKFNEEIILFDEPFMNYLQLLKEGVLAKNIKISSEDTYDNNLFFSASKKTPDGRMVSIIVRRN
jgi:YfiH family protein